MMTGRARLLAPDEAGMSESDSYVKQFVCLANSRKMTGRCIAGKELIGDRIGRWIRPVSSRPTEEISTDERRLPDDDDEPGLLDVLEVRFLAPKPHSCQVENHLVDPAARWLRAGRFPLKRVRELYDRPVSLWVNGDQSARGVNDRVPTEEADRLVSSLFLVQMDHPSLVVEPSFGKLCSQGRRDAMTDAAFTIGHSNHTIERFVELLKLHGMSRVVDVRSAPYSRWMPQFNRESLAVSLNRHGIAYEFMGSALGGRSPDPADYRDGRVDYARLSKSASFSQGIAALEERISGNSVVVMCSEGDPTQCHRMLLISRRLKAEGIEVRHILPSGDIASQVDLEARILEAHRLHHADLFASHDETLDRAYRLQEERVAYVRDAAPDSMSEI